MYNTRKFSAWISTRRARGECLEGRVFLVKEPAWAKAGGNWGVRGPEEPCSSVLHLRAVGSEGWRVHQRSHTWGSGLTLRGDPGGEGSDRNQEETQRGNEAKWAPASYLSSRSWPGPPRTRWPGPCPVPVAGCRRAPSCLPRWPSSPGSCCWSSAPWSAGAAARSQGHPGPSQQAGEAEGGGGGRGQATSQLLPLPPSHHHLHPMLQALRSLHEASAHNARSIHTQCSHYVRFSVVSGISLQPPDGSGSPLWAGRQVAWFTR